MNTKKSIINLLKRQRYYFSENVNKETEEVKDKVNEEFVLPEFSKEELNKTRLSNETLLKGFLPLKEKVPEAYQILKKELETITKEQKFLDKLREEKEILKKINDENHKKLLMMVDRVKDSEKEAERIEKRLTKQIDKEKKDLKFDSNQASYNKNRKK